MAASPNVLPPRQARSQRTLERLVKSALDILESEGPEALTVQGVVARAGSSVGSFYARFGGKDDLLDYLRERVWAEALERWEAALASKNWSDLSLGEIIEGAVALLLETEHSRLQSLRALDRAPGRASDGYATFQRHLLAGLEALLLARAADIAHPRPHVAVRLGLRAVRGVVAAEVDGAGSPLGREVLVHECRDLLTGYLGGTPPARDDRVGEGVDFFHVWG